MGQECLIFFCYLLQLITILIAILIIYFLLLEIAFYYVPGSVLGSENTIVNHIQSVTAFKESTHKKVWWITPLVSEFTQSILALRVERNENVFLSQHPLSSPWCVHCPGVPLSPFPTHRLPPTPKQRCLLHASVSTWPSDTSCFHTQRILKSWERF